jgi:uncharacterized protein (TIGR02453 family)
MAKQTKQQPQVPKSGFDFFKTLKKNNNREWFNAHKTVFLAEQDLIAVFAEALLQELSEHDEIETPSGKKSLFRIYRDTRFSNNKTPYKTNWSGYFKRATKYKRGGYYFHLEPGNSFVAGGFWSPNPADLKRIREDIAFDDAPLRKIIKSRSFVSTFGALTGEQVATAPKGFPKDHEAIDLLRYKQFLLIKRFSDQEVLSEGFLKAASQAFKNMRPFFDYMSEVLATDSNGIG